MGKGGEERPSIRRLSKDQKVENPFQVSQFLLILLDVVSLRARLRVVRLWMMGRSFALTGGLCCE